MKVKLLSRVRLRDPMDCSPPGSSIHGIFQARILEWGATAFSDPSPSRPQLKPCLTSQVFLFCIYDSIRERQKRPRERILIFLKPYPNPEGANGQYRDSQNCGPHQSANSHELIKKKALLKPGYFKGHYPKLAIVFKINLRNFPLSAVLRASPSDPGQLRDSRKSGELRLPVLPPERAPSRSVRLSRLLSP